MVVLKALVISTSGLKSDGITAWIRQIVTEISGDEVLFETVAWDNADPAVLCGVEGCGARLHILPNRQRHPLGYARALLCLMKRDNFDIVHVCGSSGLMVLELHLAKRAAVPVRICHSHNTACRHRVLDRLLRPAMRGAATAFFACGTDAGRWLFGERPFDIVSNGRDLGVYRFDPVARREARAELGLMDGEVALGHVGRFNEQKNHGMLLKILAELRGRGVPCRLLLIGDGALFEKVRGAAEAMGLERVVSFLGRREDVPWLLNAMDCMVLPSLYEGFPNVVVEWQANGLPCVVSKTVTRECAVTPLVRFSPLGDGFVNAWADEIEKSLASSNRSADSGCAQRGLREGGYDAADSAARLLEAYERFAALS